MRKKAQIRMSETIAVLVIFFILVAFGLVFYYNYSKIAIKEEQEEILGMKAMDITLKSLFLPELICSKGEAEAEDNCFDMMKLRQVGEKEGVFSKHYEDYYFELFPYTRINVTKLYPEPKEEWILYDKEKTKKVTNEAGIEEDVPGWERKESTYFVVTLRDKDESRIGEYRYSLGVLTVEVYS